MFWRRIKHATPTYPLLDNSVLFSHLNDFHMKNNAALPAFVYSEAPGSLTEISFLEYGRATHRAGRIIRSDRSGPDNEVVALIANLDTLLYQTLLLGMMRVGIVPFLMSPRNSAEAIMSLLTKTGCHRILTTGSSLGTLMKEISDLVPADFPLIIHEAPTLKQCYHKLGQETAEHPFIAYPHTITSRSPDEVIMYQHSSGTTGLPKPVPHTSRNVIGWCTLDIVADWRTIGRPGAMHLPPFHSMGAVFQLLIPLANAGSVALYPPTSFSDPKKPPIAPTSDNIQEHCQRTNVSAIIVTPNFIETWASQPKSVQWLKTLKFVGFGGGPLSPLSGNHIAGEGVKLIPIYGGTEFGPLVTITNGSQDRSLEDWNYMRFSSKLNVRMVPGPDGTFESQYLDTENYKVSVRNLSDVSGYASSDCWVPHPSKPGFWRIVGRLDDVIILASGENVVPASMETTIMSCPLVSGAVVFGRGRNQVGVLLEPTPGVPIGDLNAYRSWTWPFIDLANIDAPTFGRIFQDMVIVTDAKKRMVRVGKGTVARKATLNLYASEIDALYKTMEADADASTVVEPPKTWEAHDIEPWLVVQVLHIYSDSIKNIHVDVDLFEQGFDSAGATFLRNRIIGSLRHAQDAGVHQAAEQVKQNVVYSHPNIKDLSAYLAGLVSGNDYSAWFDVKFVIEGMIEKYSSDLNQVQFSPARAPNDAVVLLTGSTGSLGSYILESLLRDDRVRTVYAYNRPSTARGSGASRQRLAWLDKGFDLGLLGSPKLVFVEGDSSSSNMGLSESMHEEIRSSVNIVIHNAWRVDFNLSLTSFETNICGTRNLIDLASRADHASSLRFMFTSTIGSAQGWARDDGAFPEEVQLDVATAVGGGYGESKYITERILSQSGLQVCSFRIGQIAIDQPRGAWNISDWLPRIVKSSFALGALPEAQGLVSWVPATVVTQAILDVAFAPESPTNALNIAHPRPSSWIAVIQAINGALVQRRVISEPLPLLPFSDWFKKLEQRSKGASEEDMNVIPAIKILEFLRGMAIADQDIRQSGRIDIEAGGLVALSTLKAQAACSSLRDAAPIGREDAHRWVDYWMSYF